MIGRSAWSPVVFTRLWTVSRPMRISIIGLRNVWRVASRIICSDYWIATRLEAADGRLTGHVLGDIVTKDTKLESLRAWAARMGIDMAQTVAVGDGANDLPMIHAAGLGVAFCAKPKVQEDAPHRLNERDLAKILDYLK